MILTIDCREMQVSQSGYNSLSVTLEGVDGDDLLSAVKDNDLQADVLSGMSISEVIDAFGQDEILDHIGRTEVIDYFEIKECEDPDVHKTESEAVSRETD